ncbi:MAG: hypothetical protein AVDCRST_MAG56-6805 [uncultured Cytophagales bacterium]|uniref:Uncharacterized protein n=1 Tax=uncultured Cytophagales bacterium TaxID=158755 RepID=A0A6J4L075_9SPHI|nr:MAG: hypothetical protein AVDCRST_MAG56-6805 [uncultured Cytophagales bacterium]
MSPAPAVSDSLSRKTVSRSAQRAPTRKNDAGKSCRPASFPFFQSHYRLTFRRRIIPLSRMLFREKTHQWRLYN